MLKRKFELIHVFKPLDFIRELAFRCHRQQQRNEATKKTGKFKIEMNLSSSTIDAFSDRPERLHKEITANKLINK